MALEDYPSRVEEMSERGELGQWHRLYDIPVGACARLLAWAILWGMPNSDRRA